MGICSPWDNAIFQTQITFTPYLLQAPNLASKSTA